MALSVVYPRGFLGFDIGLPHDNTGNSISKLLEAVRLNKTISDNSKVVVSNHKVENVWKQYKNGDRFINSFAFREQILKLALEAFGTKSFYDWCVLQSDSPYMSEMHKRFLNDTFNFIETGKRSVNILSWMKLITVKELSKNDEVPVYQYQKFFGMTSPIQFRREHNLSTILTLWVSQPGGFDDLVGSLHIFFGDANIA